MDQLDPDVWFQIYASKAAGGEPDEQQLNLPEASNPWGLGSAMASDILAHYGEQCPVSCHGACPGSPLCLGPDLLICFFQAVFCLGGDVEVVQQCVSEGRISLQALGPCPQHVKVAGSWVNFHRMRHSPVTTQHFWHPTAASLSHLIIFFIRVTNSRY